MLKKAKQLLVVAALLPAATAGAQDIVFIDPLFHPGRVEDCLAAANQEEARNAQTCRDLSTEALESLQGFPEGPLLDGFVDRIYAIDLRCHTLSLRLHFLRSQNCNRFQDPWVFAHPVPPFAALEWIDHCSQLEVDCFDDLDAHFLLWEPEEPGDPVDPGDPLEPLGEF